MRKRIITQGIQETSETAFNWLNLEEIAEVEISSEQEGFPIEAALIADSGSCWQAADSGEQTIRLLFDQPQSIRVIRLLFQEQHQERTQEFVLRWSPDQGDNFHDISRQQYNFSSPDSTRQLEIYHVDLDGVTALELCIIPNISGGDTRASLTEWRIA
ncbi:hypothetical protein Ga0123461_2235 [Mariprofundus aestuarium]|uniref:F5/8 type C domain-containing protein n=1 Tax=Mariprofundus aestuarium TaxID=1921086 RepID=A0A2K8L026_MARES|nr:hypothetical protein [Mariprofundus aestuarium]ATX80640.1 hypothetical protein Ga0123461_2235 [Mariprofundus aestuarium]